MSNDQSPSRQSFDRIVEHIKHGFANYADHWQEWIGPMLIAAVFMIAALSCCVFPYFLAMGPITTALYACALAALRQSPIEPSMLRLGWEKVVPSALASLVINALAALPVILMYGGFLGFFVAMVAVLPQPEPDPLAEGEAVYVWPEGTEDESDSLSEEEATSDSSESPDAGPSDDAIDEPPPALMLGVIALMFVFYFGMFVVMILIVVFQMWLTTRLMFVFPLIADRGLGCFAALGESWRATRTQFWELLIVNFVASLIGMLGMYAMYIGMLFTIPIWITIIGSVYKERFRDPEKASPDTQPPVAAPAWNGGANSSE